MKKVEYPTLTAYLDIKEDFNNEEKLKQYQETKDESLKEEIFINNIPLLIDIAKDYVFPTKMEFGDLISIGSIGLIKAIDSYRDQGTKFSTYAQTSIVNTIAKEVNAWYGEGREYYGSLIKKYRQIAIALFGENKYIYDEENMDYILGIMLEENLIRKGSVEEVKSRLLTMGTTYTTELVEDVEYEEEDFNRVEFIRKYKDRFFRVLTDREKEVMEYRCGYKDRHAYLQKELAEILGVSHQAVQQQEQKAVTKMKRVADLYI